MGNSCPHYSLDNLGSDSCQWSTPLLGDQNDWQSAGEGALGLGAIGVILLGFAAIATLVSLCIRTFPKWPGAFSAFLAGIAFVIGALVFDSMRPSWGGDMGYKSVAEAAGPLTACPRGSVRSLACFGCACVATPWVCTWLPV